MSKEVNKIIDIKTAQKHEALLRMKKLNIHENAINEFRDEDKLNLSEPAFGNRVGVLFWLNQDEEKMVRKWEAETGNLVYHVIKNRLREIGLCYSFLYVSQDPEEWALDNEDLDEGIQVVYVKNADDDGGSEYGSIGIKGAGGGVVRTA